MKALAIWVVVVSLVFGAAAGIYHVARSRDPEQVFVVVDSSFPMAQDWAEVQTVLDGLDGDRYAEYALATEKTTVHTWADELHLAGVTAYAPRDLSKLLRPDAYPEMEEASKLVLVTNAPAAETEALVAWEIVRVGG